jgi:hypothetical protein
MAKHQRWTTVITSRPEENGKLDGWVGVSSASLDEFRSGTVHGRKVVADNHCTPDCPSAGPDCGR